MIIMEKMNDCYSKVYNRVINSVKESDLTTIFKTLDEIKGPTLITGVGGSSVVSSYLEKVLNKKNHIITRFISPCDMNKIDISGYENVIAVSYSGGNVGVEVSFKNNLKKYLFSKNEKEGITPIKYNVTDSEMSYVSISATLIPMAILYLYFSNNNQERLIEIMKQTLEYHLIDKPIIEVLYSEVNKTSSTMLESTLTEGGLAACILHDKYNYCHGRLNLNKEYDNLLVYFDDDSDLDRVFKDNLKKHYKNIITIVKKYDDEMANEFYFAYQTLLMSKELAEKKNIDLSSIKEDPVNDIYYLFKGSM